MHLFFSLDITVYVMRGRSGPSVVVGRPVVAGGLSGVDFIPMKFYGEPSSLALGFCVCAEM